jgi:hypothetical protein
VRRLAAVDGIVRPGGGGFFDYGGIFQSEQRLQAGEAARWFVQAGVLCPQQWGVCAGREPGPSIDSVPFPTIAGVVAQQLAARNYFLAKDAKSADLLLVIQWGSTVPFDDGSYRNGVDQLSGSMNSMRSTKVQGPTTRSVDGIQSDGASAAQAAQSAAEGDLVMMQMFNGMREKANEQNARLLGYMGEINSVNDLRRFAGGGTYYDDLISDIEDRRYYVIVSAYDFRAAVQEKNKKLLWSTRVSIQAQGNHFDERLMTMMANASRQFGQNSGRLIRQFQRAPRVVLGELKILGVVPESAPKEQSAQGK